MTKQGVSYGKKIGVTLRFPVMQFGGNVPVYLLKQCKKRHYCEKNKKI